jgi:transcriptional regulator with XRE-family HTH domain
MRSAMAIPYQGRRTVARNPAAASWGVFLRSHLANRNLNQAEFGRRMEAAGYPISKQTASQWYNGENAPDANMALAVAAALGAQDTDALRAAGFDPVARRIAQGNAKPEAQDPTDPIISEIMAMEHLGLKVRKALIAQYLADQEAARRRAQDLARAWAGQNGDDSAA